MTAAKATAHLIALHSAAPGATVMGEMIALQAETGAPEWVQLLPAGVIKTVDGRGPYRVADMAQLAAASLQAAGGKMLIDETHATDLAAPKGEPAPARGWIVDLQARADGGLYGKVDWTSTGRSLVTEKEYRGISPVFAHDKQHNVLRVLRASLTNTPNLIGMTSIHQEQTMEELLNKLRALLGLDADADFSKIFDAVNSIMTVATAEKAKAQAGAALQSQIAKATGLKEGAAGDVILNAVTTLATQVAAGGVRPETITALQAELADLTTKHNSLVKDGATKRATAFVDGEIAKGRVGVKPMRTEYIAMHAENPEHTEKLINAMPILGASGALQTPPTPDKDGKIALNAEQIVAADLLGVAHDKYAATLAAENSASN